MVYNTPSGWAVFYSSGRVERELKALAEDVRSDFSRLVQLIQTYGLENMREPHVKHLTGKLWEMRMRGRDGIGRAAYIATSGKKVVVLHCFVKKTQQTPRDAIDLAMKRAREAGLL
jgi:phage-related protein